MTDLSRVARDRRRWVVGEAEPLGGGGGDLHALVVDRDHGVERRALVEGDDRLDRGAGVGQRDAPGRGSPMSSAIAWRSSDPTTTSTPRRVAARMKSVAR